ncbi:MAG TPA: SPASM domain-containing protein [Acidimicrobiales bacterium]|nr:SPASM domain-containing protein [Acidimicrobiales bacterium]
MNELLIGLDEARRRRGVTLGICEIDSIATRLAGHGSVSCRLAGSCIGTFFVVEPNGDIDHCSRFGTDERYTFGSVVEHDFSRLRRSVRMIERRAESAAAVDRRRGCPDVDVCQGGCPHDRVVEARHDPDHDPGCCGRRPLIAHLRAARSTPVAVGAPRR